MKKMIFVVVVAALLGVSFSGNSVAEEKAKSPKGGTFISPGYFLVKLGMKKQDVESVLLKNGFKKLIDDRHGDVYIKEGSIQGYPHLRGLTYRFQFNADDRNRASYWAAWGNFHKKQGNNFWFEMRGYSVSGIAYMPSYHLPAVASYECNLPYMYANGPTNFGFNRDAPLISFKVEMSITEEYKEVFGNNFIKKLSGTYGQPNAIGYAKSGAESYDQVDAAWVDDKFFVAARSYNWGRDFDLYFTISQEEPLRKKLADLEQEGIRLIQQCKQVKEKSFNQIKID